MTGFVFGTEKKKSGKRRKSLINCNTTEINKCKKKVQIKS